MKGNAAVGLGALALAASAGWAQVGLTYNWNGIVHTGEGTTGFADDPGGYRSMADRGLAVGNADSLGGTVYTFETDAGVYNVEAAAGELDMVMIGQRMPNGNPPWDDAVDGDAIGIAPDWDPTGLSGAVIQATTSVPSIVLDADFSLGIVYNGAEGGGSFEMVLGFADGDSVEVTITSPDWFANFDPVPPAPGDGVASQITLPGPLSGGDGYFGTNTVDLAVPGEPLSVFEAVVTADSLLVGQLFDVDGRTLTSITFDATNMLINSPSASVGIFGATLNGEPQKLDFNWNGVAQPPELAETDADGPDGYRTIGDRGFAAGQGDSLGGEAYGFTSDTRSYSIESAANVVDMVMIGTRPAAWDDEVDGDNIGVAPDWDPSKGGGIVVDSTTEVPNLALDDTFELGIVYHATNGGGDFDVHLGFADGAETTVTLNAPDWFANNNPVPPPPGAGVASQEVLPGPLSGGDGFLGAEAFDLGLNGAPLSAFEAVITAQSLSDNGFDVSGRQLTSITFDALNLLLQNPNAAVGIYAISLGGEGCIADCDGNGMLNVLDFVCFQQEWQAQTATGDCDGNGLYNILDFVCFQTAFQSGCP